MLLKVNPNRMELLRLRRRLILAQRGHKLLEDKLEQMLRRFTLLVKEIETARQDFNLRTERMLRDLLYCRITSEKEDFKSSLSKIIQELKIRISFLKILNVKVPVFEIEKFKIDRQYDFFKTSAQLDLVIAQARDYLGSLLRLAQLLKTLEILSFEIERTRRRVNALEFLLIPYIQDTIRYINQKLAEFERGNLTRLMRIKEIIRAH
ncbi:MAG: V-type ATP synthase subunit D [Candidatus Omnitrophica bacterium]|nr:V-type ATP synthase subunit D [Candidatus Omnitrophota bacterium]